MVKILFVCHKIPSFFLWWFQYILSTEGFQASPLYLYKIFRSVL